MAAKKQNINDGHYLELMDRLYIMASNLEDYVMMHPVVLDNKKLNKNLDQALTLLANAYQEVGAIMYRDLYKKEDDARRKSKRVEKL